MLQKAIVIVIVTYSGDELYEETSIGDNGNPRTHTQPIDAFP